jgi:hypothetical protein
MFDEDCYCNYLIRKLAAKLVRLRLSQVMKELFAQIFGTPKNHRKAKPFVDHVLSFSLADNRIWIRNYQVRYGVQSELSAQSFQNERHDPICWILPRTPL